MVLIYQLLSAPSCVNWECIVRGFFVLRALGWCLSDLHQVYRAVRHRFFVFRKDHFASWETIMLFLHK